MLSLPVHAETVLVVAANSPIHTLSHQEVAAIFLGKSQIQLKSDRIVPLDQAKDTLREEFYKDYLDKTLSQVKSHWAKIIFTGRGYPPRTVSNFEELKNVLHNNPNALGYADRSMVDGSLRIVQLN